MHEVDERFSKIEHQACGKIEIFVLAIIRGEELDLNLFFVIVDRIVGIFDLAIKRPAGQITGLVEAADTLIDTITHYDDINSIAL